MVYEVTVSYYESGVKVSLDFSIKATTLDELKQGFLKRFGNILATNKSMKEKPLVKELTYKARSLAEWVQLVNATDRWEIHIGAIY